MESKTALATGSGGFLLPAVLKSLLKIFREHFVHILPTGGKHDETAENDLPIFFNLLPLPPFPLLMCVFRWCLIVLLCCPG